MNKRMIILISVVLFVSSAAILFAQSNNHPLAIDFKQTLLIGFDGTPSISFEIEGITGAGNGFTTTAISNTARLFYTGLFLDSLDNNIITIQLGSAAALDIGLTLTATAGAPSGTGDPGTSTGAQDISDGTAKTLITGINGCYTGVDGGSGDGALVTFALTVTNPQNFNVADSVSDTIVYTIADS